MENKYNFLNEIYDKINQKKELIITYLAESGFELSSGFFNGHFCKIGNSFLEEKYPIPVITVNEVIDIGVDIDNIFLEFRVTKEFALNINYHIMPRPFELYGLNDFLDDLYNKDLDINEIKQKIIDSNETEFGLTFSFSYDEDIELLLEIVENLLHL
ncbi:DUF3201 domain-containing protein [Acholeplasma sp. OttesenSCG-928-E16]|nr:DUF3201 domain-containing protein [Acholeplasma sp. OttesenSCG-928-E16]